MKKYKLFHNGRTWIFQSTETIVDSPVKTFFLFLKKLIKSLEL